MKKIDTAPVSRRGFLRWGALTGSAALVRPVRGRSGTEIGGGAAAAVPGAGERMVRTGCPSHNCGGRCLLRVFVKDGVIVRIEGDDRPTDTVSDPQLRACIRGRAYRRRQYHPDRLKYPMKRVGPRGEGRFERISWDEALDRVAWEIVRVRERVRQRRHLRPLRHGRLQPD